MKRIWISLIAVLTVGVLVVGCGDYDSRDSNTSGNAAVVNGEELSNAQFQKELDALASNQKLVAAVEAQSKQQGQSQTLFVDGKASPELAASWLTQDINYMIVKQAAADLKVSVTAKDKQAAEKQAESGYPSAEAWKAFPDWFRTMQIEQIATSTAVQTKLTSTKPTDAELQALLATVPAAQLPQVQCISHILLPASDAAKAAKLKQQIDDGANFAELAKENSTDPGSAKNGGSLGCLRSDNSNLDPTFQKAADAAVVGKVTDPVTSQFGIHLILVTDRHPAGLEDLRTELTQGFEQQAIAKYMSAFSKKAKVTVDKQWGTVALSEGGQWQVTPPSNGTTTTAPVTQAPATEPPAPESTTTASTPAPSSTAPAPGSSSSTP